MEEDAYFVRNEESLRFLHGLCSRDLTQRHHAAEAVIEKINCWVDGYGSPTEQYILHDGNNEHIGELTVSFRHMVHEQLPDLLRISTRCPFSDVQETISTFLQDLRVIIVVILVTFQAGGGLQEGAATGSNSYLVLESETLFSIMTVFNSDFETIPITIRRNSLRY